MTEVCTRSRPAPDQIYPKTPPWEHLQVAPALVSEGKGDNPILATTAWPCRPSPHPPRAPGSLPDGKATTSPHESTTRLDPRQCRVSPCSIAPCAGHPRGGLTSGFLKLEREAVPPTPPCRTPAACSAEETPSWCSRGWLDFPSPPSAAHSILQRRNQGEELEETGARGLEAAGSARPPRCAQPGAGPRLTTCTISAFRSFSRRRFRFSSRRRFFSCGSSTKTFPAGPSFPPGLKPKPASIRSRCRHRSGSCTATAARATPAQAANLPHKAKPATLFSPPTPRHEV